MPSRKKLLNIFGGLIFANFFFIGVPSAVYGLYFLHNKPERIERIENLELELKKEYKIQEIQQNPNIIRNYEKARREYETLMSNQQIREDYETFRRKSRLTDILVSCAVYPALLASVVGIGHEIISKRKKTNNSKKR